MVMERQLKPVIVFSFSRQNCEALALDMSKLDFNTRELLYPALYLPYRPGILSIPQLTSINVLCALNSQITSWLRF